MQDKQSVWSVAAGPGLVLGAVSAIYLLASHLLGHIDANILRASLSVLIWIAKFVGCILLLKLFMKRYVSTIQDADSSDSFKFGVVVALLSAFVFSAAYFAYAQFIAPDMFTEAFAAVQDAYSEYLDSAAIEELQNFLPDLPKWLFGVNLVYCFLYGTALSAILCRDIPSRNPFADNNSVE